MDTDSKTFKTRKSCYVHVIAIDNTLIIISFQKSKKTVFKRF